MLHDYDYGFGELENKLIRLFRSGAPDFSAAEELLKQGADINAFLPGSYENVLSCILYCYSLSMCGDDYESTCGDCDNGVCENCEFGIDLDPNCGESMCEIIRFFLEHGFDLDKLDGCFGASCLDSLVHSTDDRYMLDATKLLLDSGARNCVRTPSSAVTPFDSAGFERRVNSLDGIGEMCSIYEVLCQIYLALDEGRPYGGINTYELAVGKKITAVLAKCWDNSAVFYSIHDPVFSSDNCYMGNLYFVYDGGELVCSDTANVWTDTALPDCELENIAGYLDGIVGATIKGIEFSEKSILKKKNYFYESTSQATSVIEMDSGVRVKFSTNFGDVPESMMAAYYEFLDE